MIILALTTFAWCGIGLAIFLFLCMAISMGNDSIQEQIRYRERFAKMTPEEKAREKQRSDRIGW